MKNYKEILGYIGLGISISVIIVVAFMQPHLEPLPPNCTVENCHYGSSKIELERMIIREMNNCRDIFKCSGDSIETCILADQTISYPC